MQTISCSPLFIVGCPRSGTTLLQAKLSAISSTAIPPEDDFILRFYKKLNHDLHVILDKSTISDLLDDLFQHDGQTFQFWHVKRDDIVTEIKAAGEEIDLRVLIDCIYKAFLNRLDGKVRWGCKVPYFSAHVKTLANIFPEAQFIHIIRDGRAIYQSMLERKKVPGARTFPESPFVVGWMWKRFVTYAQRDGRLLGENFLTIQYEHLLASPKQTELKIASFLGEDRSELKKDYFGQLKKNKLLRDDNITLYVKPKIDSSKAQRWRNELSNFQICAFQEMTSKQLRKYDYVIEKCNLSLTKKLIIISFSRLYTIYQKFRVFVKKKLIVQFNHDYNIRFL